MTTTETVSTPRSKAALAALVFGVVGLPYFILLKAGTLDYWHRLIWPVDYEALIFGALTGYAGMLLTVLAVICGHVGLVKTKAGKRRGREWAIIGLTLGYALVALYAAWLGSLEMLGQVPPS